MYAHNLRSMQTFEIINHRRVRFTNFWDNMNVWQNLMVAMLFAFLTVLGAKIRLFVPFTPVPFTLQTFFIMTASLYLRERWAPVSTGIYLLLGLVGLPVFAGNGSGIEYLMGATGGYLLAFLVVPPLMSHIFHRHRYAWKSAFAASMTGSMLILLIGSIYLGVYLGNLSKGLLLGFLPFVSVELLKALCAATSAKVLLAKRC